MNYGGVCSRRWTLAFDKARIDVWFNTVRGKVTEFAITLSSVQGGVVQPVIRYDTAHGIVHRHTFWGDRERIEDDPFGTSDPTTCFRLAYQDVMDNFDQYLERFEQKRWGR